MFIKHLMMIKVNEWEGMYRSEQKKWIEESLIMFGEHVVIVEMIEWECLGSK
jgi:hypothetical protein